MATFVDLPAANGQIKTKAVCRVWNDGKQIAKCKTFKTRSEAEKWALGIEQSMKKSSLIEKVNGSGINIQTKSSVSEAETLSDILDLYLQSSACLMPLLDIPILILGANKLAKHFENRMREGATSEDIQLEADLLTLLFRYSDRKHNRRSSNLVAMALTAFYLKSEN